MNVRRGYAVGGALVAASAVFGALAYPEMPAEMATHWNGAGEVDGRMPRLLALGLFPALMAALLGLFAALPRVDPLGENVAEFRAQYDTFVVLVLAFLAYLQALVVGVNAGYEFEMIQGLAPAVGALYYYVGVLSAHAERNWFVGIRTPWTISSDEVWDRTHRRAAPLFKLAGVVAALGALVPAYAELLVVAPVVAVSLYATVFSYVEYRRVGAECRPEFSTASSTSVAQRRSATAARQSEKETTPTPVTTSANDSGDWPWKSSVDRSSSPMAAAGTQAATARTTADLTVRVAPGAYAPAAKDATIQPTRNGATVSATTRGCRIGSTPWRSSPTIRKPTSTSRSPSASSAAPDERSTRDRNSPSALLMAASWTPAVMIPAMRLADPARGTGRSRPGFGESGPADDCPRHRTSGAASSRNQSTSFPSARWRTSLAVAVVTPSDSATSVSVAVRGVS